MKEHPNIAISLTLALGNSAALKLRQTTARLDSLISAKSDPRVEEMISKAQAAQRQILEWSEERIDQLLHALAAAIYEQAEPLAQAAVQETGIGNVADKVIKNKVASLGVYQSLAGQRGFGLMPADPKGGKVYDLAHPMGVIFGLVPVTNPTSTFIFKTLICLKSRNALILSPNRRAAGVSNQMGEIIRGVLREHGASENMVQWVDARANRKLTVTFMGHSQIALILATGGPSMVKAAYSSGNPAIGVGSGNAPVLITRTADLEHAARSVVLSKFFDYGLICGSEHNLVVEEAVLPAFTQQLEKAGAAILNPTEAKMLLSQVIDPKINGLREIVVGQDPAKIAAFFKFQRPYPIRLLVVPSGEINADNPMAREKMAPILSLFTVRDAEEGLAVSRKLLSFDGQGHTAIIYSTDEALIERFGLEMPASRILVNSPGAHGVVGISTSLIPSLTLGCGTFGGTSTTDNVTFRNLVNVKRLAYFTPERFAALAEL
jgi:acyl-CoA reductase-like NAD-dependent aldehyde dehydrogenase